MDVRDPSPESQDDAQQGERLQRVLASRGIASRRASEELIRQGRVSVNGHVVTVMGSRVDPDEDEIRVDGQSLQRQRPRFVMLNKPSGFITTIKDERQRWTVMDLVDVPERIFPVGRLDRDTQGLLLLTNDGGVANRVMHPRYGLAKEYHVITDARPTDSQISRLSAGLIVAGREVVPDECRLLRETSEGIIVKIVLHEGLYHVVRTMMETVGINIVRLGRVRLGPLRIQGVPPGSWRDLTPGELVQLFEAVGLPMEDADKINLRRPMQLLPLGGFRHGGSEDDAAFGGGGARPPAPGPSQRPVLVGDSGRPGPGQRRLPAAGRARGKPNDGSRSPSSHRDRRSGRGR